MNRRSRIDTPAIGHDNNLTAVRYLLALAVLVAHFNYLTGASVAFPVTSYQGVCGFFTISGFLIFKSFHHADGNIRHYLGRRALRILPSYFFIVILAATALAAISTLTPGEYFRSTHTWRYLIANLSFMNFIEPSLPGVFDSGTATDAVNGSLWTMKVEWALYLSVPPVAWLILRRGYRPWLVIGSTYLLSVAYRWGLWTTYCHTTDRLFEILSRQFFGQMTFFYLGVLLYCYYDRTKPWLPHIGVGALIIAAAGAFMDMQCTFYRFAIEPVILAAIVLSLGLVGTWGRLASRFTDCSYEIYLFHFPVIQLVATGCPGMSPTATFITTTVSTIVLSYLTARYISLTLRRRLSPRQILRR